MTKIDLLIFPIVLFRGHSITTWTRWGRGSKNVCFCPRSRYKNCPCMGCTSCWMTPKALIWWIFWNCLVHNIKCIFFSRIVGFWQSFLNLTFWVKFLSLWVMNVQFQIKRKTCQNAMFSILLKMHTFKTDDLNNF